MTGDGVPNDEMPNILRPGRRDALPLSDAALAALLAGTEPPAGPAPELRPVADVLAALRADPTGDELAGEAAALVEFRRGTGTAVPRQSRHRRPRVLPSRLSARAAAALGVAAVTLGGLVTAAYAGILPAPVQRFAHDTIGAPAAPSSPPAGHHLHLAKSHASARHGATGSVMPGSCIAYLRARAHGTAAQQVTAFRGLIKAAGGTGEVTTYCGKTMPAPGRPASRSAHRAHERVPPAQRDKKSPPRQGQGQGHQKSQPGQGHQNSQQSQGHQQSQKGQNHNRSSKGQNGQGRGQHATRPENQPSALHTERRRHPRAAHAAGHGAYLNPARHRAVIRHARS